MSNRDSLLAGNASAVPAPALLIHLCGMENNGAYRILPAGDTAIVIEFGDSIDRSINSKVLALADRLQQRPIEGLIEYVPTFRSLILHYDPLSLSTPTLKEHVAELLRDLQPKEKSGRTWHLPVCYDAHVAPDLHEVASRTGLSPAQVVEAHSAGTYHVYMLGFLPGMAYMGDLPEVLVLPRLPTPRLKVPAGSLAIATTMTCIIPLETASGWHLIGRSPIPFVHQLSYPEALLAAGDTIKFEPVSLDQYEQLSARAACPSPSVVPWQNDHGPHDTDATRS
jgi:KipI family sensor histidine kinase inhibitor